jgi:hypothetical protein
MGDIILVPASLTVLTKDFFEDNTSAESVLFEAGSRLRRLETGTFHHCRWSVKWIRIPRSVQFIGKELFVKASVAGGWHPSARAVVNTITFERGSKLRQIKANAFCGCIFLTQFHIPASVKAMDARSLPPHSKCQITISSRNPYFKRKADFLIDLNKHHILRYFGEAPDVLIPDEIEQIGEQCFKGRGSIRVVRFGSTAKLTSIRKWAFGHCSQLKAITIPSSVMLLGPSCFFWCSALETLSFCPGSEIARIGKKAFANCSSLQSLHLPSSLEVIGEHCFAGCELLSSLTFASPSRIRELLCFPRVWGNLVCIPDSVEVLDLTEALPDSQSNTVVFGSESRLTEIRRRYRERISWNRVFCQFSVGALKRFRTNMEYSMDVELAPVFGQMIGAPSIQQMPKRDSWNPCNVA